MSINFNQIPASNVPASFWATNNNSPWHAVHSKLDEECKYNLKLALQTAGEDYDVIKQQLPHPFIEGKMLDNAFGLFRSDNHAFYGTCKSRYTPQNNFDVLSPLFEMMKDCGIGLESMAFWPTGHVAVNFKVMDTEPIKGDTHQHYLQAYFGHDGITVINYLDSVVRMVCSNTVTHALNSANNLLKVKHTIGAQKRLSDYAMLIGGMKHEIKTFEERLAFLASKKMTVDQVNTVLNTIFGEPKVLKTTGEIKYNARQIVLNMFESNDDNAFPSIRGTFYNMANAFSQKDTHADPVTIQGNYNKSDREAIETSRRIKNTITNGNSDFNKFMALAMEMTK